MNLINKVIVTTALAGILAMNGTSSVLAADIAPEQTMKPLHAISFNVGTKHAVSYFSRENETCKLVLTLADAPDWKDVSSFTATRFEAAVPAGAATRFNPTAGKSLEFACQENAQAIRVKAIEQVAVD